MLAGRIHARGLAFPKPGQRVPDDLSLDVIPAPTYVSRGGVKLAHAVTHFGIDVRDRVCADIGASTGGFTDCLLQHGARRVYAIDVGYGQLDWSLRVDPRVVVMDRTNARYLEQLPEPVSLVVLDASFIAIRVLLPAVARISDEQATLIALIKPQFEVGKGRVGKGGIVRDRRAHREVLESVAEAIRLAGHALLGLTASPIRGADGNVEFLAHVRIDGSGVVRPSGPCVRETWVDDEIDRALEEAHTGTI